MASPVRDIFQCSYECSAYTYYSCREGNDVREISTKEMDDYTYSHINPCLTACADIYREMKAGASNLDAEAFREDFLDRGPKKASNRIFSKNSRHDICKNFGKEMALPKSSVQNIPQPKPARFSELEESVEDGFRWIQLGQGILNFLRSPALQQGVNAIEQTSMMVVSFPLFMLGVAVSAQNASPPEA